MYPCNEAAQAAFCGAFADKEVRRVFVQRVFGIVALQLAFTLGVGCIFMFVDPVKPWVQANPWMLWIAFIGFFGAS